MTSSTKLGEEGKCKDGGDGAGGVCVDYNDCDAARGEGGGGRKKGKKREGGVTNSTRINLHHVLLHRGSVWLGGSVYS